MPSSSYIKCGRRVFGTTCARTEWTEQKEGLDGIGSVGWSQSEKIATRGQCVSLSLFSCTGGRKQVDWPSRLDLRLTYFSRPHRQTHKSTSSLSPFLFSFHSSRESHVFSFSFLVSPIFSFFPTSLHGFSNDWPASTPITDPSFLFHRAFFLFF